MHEAVKKDTGNRANQLFSISSAVFKRLQWTYLIGYLLSEGNYTILTQSIFTKTFFFQTAVGNHLPDSYRYALYDSYNIDRSNIELLNVVSYGSSLLIGTFTSALADR
jgi:hypothetical protein